MPRPAIQEDAGGVIFTAKIVPGSSRTIVAGVLDDMIKVRVAAPPEKGKANQALVAYLADELGVKKNQIDILSGQTNPVKQVRVAGISAATLLARLGLDQ
jgi:uncharacterized protein (TIGR00251 family)